MASKVEKVKFEDGEIPTKREQIDKYYVVAYTKAHGTPEQRAAIKNVILENTVERISNFTKEPYKAVNMGKVRDLFCDYFFPKLNEKKETSFEDELSDL